MDAFWFTNVTIRTGAKLHTAQLFYWIRPRKLVVEMAIFNALVNNKLTRYSFASSQKNDCIKMVVGRGPAEFHF